MMDRLSLQPREADQLPFYEFLHYRKKLAEKIKAENDAHARQQKEHDNSKAKNASKPKRGRFSKWRNKLK